MLSKVLFTSTKDDWATPDWFFEKLDAMFGFTLDACASAENAKCQKYFSKTQDGLAQRWRGKVFCNPPYSQVADWMQKAFEESQRGAVVVCLVPARTCTQWWHNWVEGKADVVFVEGRLRFGNAKNPAPFPSAVVVYTGKH